MLLLTSATDVIRVITDSVATIDVHASWVDNVSGTITPGRTNTEITTATTTTVVAGPASGQRNVQTMLVTNTDASVSNTVTIQYFDGVTAVNLFKLSLSPGYTIQFAAGSGFAVFTASGVILSAGAAGATGPAGPQGPQLYSVMQGDPGEDASEYYGLTTGVTDRSKLAPNAKNWAFLGRAKLAAIATTVGPVIWTGTYANLYFEYVITGYSGAGVGRVLMGAGTPSTSALTNAIRLIETPTVSTVDGTAVVPVWSTLTTLAAGPLRAGLPLSSVSSSVGRAGVGWVWGDSGSVKSMKVEGNQSTGTTTITGAQSPTTFIGSSYFTDGGTNLPIQQMQITAYNLLTGVVVGANTMNVGTYIAVWGRNND